MLNMLSDEEFVFNYSLEDMPDENNVFERNVYISPGVTKFSFDIESYDAKTTWTITNDKEFDSNKPLVITSKLGTTDSYTYKFNFIYVENKFVDNFFLLCYLQTCMCGMMFHERRYLKEDKAL